MVSSRCKVLRCTARSIGLEPRAIGIFDEFAKRQFCAAFDPVEWLAPVGDVSEDELAPVSRFIRC